MKQEPARWRIARAVLGDIESHAREAHPAECCGVLIGTLGTIASSRRARNLSADPNRFDLDPQAHVAAIRETRGTGHAVVGFYHSHPHSAPIPSTRDIEESTYPNALHVIVGLAGGGADTRGYTLRIGGYDAVPLEIVD